MAQSEWQERLEALVAGSAGSLSGSNADLTNRMLRASAGGGTAGENSADGTTDATAGSLLAAAADVFRNEAVSLGEKLSELARASQAQTTTVEENTAAVTQSTASKVGDVVKSAASALPGLGSLSAGTAFLPLISGIAKLFGGEKTKTEPALVTYTRPAAVSVEAGIGGTGAQGEIRYDAEGVPRVVASSAGAAAPQISINVQAMDSRSFLDHSEDIARAVREAMLQTNALSDVVNDL